MTFAPQRLLQLRDYLHEQTGLPFVSLGIVGDSAHRGGYHCGRDRLVSNDYSNRTARDRAGLTEAASASDTGNFRGLVALTKWAVGEARAGRRPDSREIIGPWSDGRAYRFDHLSGWTAQLRARGDSHESHMHESWYRDSEGRDKIRFYRPFFEEDDDMQLNDPVSIPQWMQDKWPDEGLKDGTISVNTALGSGYGHARSGKDETYRQTPLIKAILAKLAGEDVADAAARASRDAVRAEFATLGPALAAQLADVPAERVEAALRNVLGSLDES